jgi:starch-binding outer membrane protein, SusD/RagB family
MKQIYKTRALLTALMLLLLSVTSCENFLEAPLPPDKITTDKVFGAKTTIEMAMLGVYSKTSVYYGGGRFVQDMEELADNLNYNPPTNIDVIANSEYDASNSEGLSSLWSMPYAAINQANLMLQSLPEETANLTDAETDQYMAENLFLRALMYFELVRMYGDVPLIMDPDPLESQSLARTPKTEVYAAIIADLKDVMTRLPETNISGLDARRCANKYVAEALLARIYLFMGDYANAETAATNVINSGNYSIETDLTGVIMRRSSEIIFSMDGPMIDAPNACWYYPFYGMPLFYQDWPEAYAWDYSGWGCLTQTAIDEFEADDQRFATLFTYSAEENVFTLKYPYSMFYQEMADADPQDFCVLRLSEMHLIRAEAKARKTSPDLAGAAADLNLIRDLHGGLPETTATTQAEMLEALEHENRVEFMCEGHRWFDLIRTNRADAVLSQLDYKTGWSAHKVLMPIPAKELINNPNLTPNPGY